MQNLVDGIYLNTYDLFLEYQISYKQCIELLLSHGVNYNNSRIEYIEFYSTILDLGYISRVILLFQNDIIQKVFITPRNGDYSIRARYPEIHDKLNSLLNMHPRKNWWSLAFYPLFFHPFVWENKKVRITHTIQERFGQHDVIIVQRLTF